MNISPYGFVQIQADKFEKIEKFLESFGFSLGPPSSLPCGFPNYYHYYQNIHYCHFCYNCHISRVKRKKIVKTVFWVKKVLVKKGFLVTKSFLVNKFLGEFLLLNM